MMRLMTWPYFARQHDPYVELNSNDYAYGPKVALTGDWLEFTFTAFRLLGERLRLSIQSFVTVGTGIGLDAIGAAYILRPRTIWALDIHEQVIPLAYDNIVHNVAMMDEPPQINVRHSRFLSGLPRSIFVDLIYENLPNIPLYKPLPYEHSILSATYLPTPVPDHDDSPITAYLLSSHQQILQEARAHLNSSGKILCSIGGRMAFPILHNLFETTGYDYQLLVVGLKEQTEPEDVLPGYAWAESRYSVTFRFVDLQENAPFFVEIETSDPDGSLVY
ncbi:hypothetical protein TPY_3155 [Sulfobacillus acidophilus TPY]|uniref:Methyltransferase n=1 Tax=Sulfobacillus acidophilus (strain ATCC 700253 / DSM 10332 / NAL) TaxID=679936 RepID=G8U149_SULAD|nr:hypothetical protein TPY_3155 [Sulfobacillus acidophilus TPY]AEW04282.1 hypothetical protein Sulac_0778 [Sulfobacillus acidophilus DSM 10332]